MHYISASQVSTYLQCERKWAFRYVLGIKEEGTSKSAELGKKVHALLEQYLQTGSFDYRDENGEGARAGEIASSSLAIIPEPGTCEVEAAFAFEITIDGTPVTFYGLKDVRADDSSVIPGCQGGAPGVLDHKTTKSFSYAKSPEDLLYDPQAQIYAADELSKNPKAETVDLAWNYLRTEGAHTTKQVRVRCTENHTRKYLKVLGEVGKELLTLGNFSNETGGATYPTDKRQASDFRASPKECGSFGGCPYRHLCPISFGERLAAEKEGRGMATALEQLRARLKTATPVLDIRQVAVPNSLQRINPPEVALVANTALSETDQAIAGTEAVIAAAEANPEITQDVTPEAAEKPKRTRAKRQEAPVDPVAPTEFPPAIETPKGYRLYVNCMPMRQDFTPLEDLIAVAKARVNEALNVDDYRFVDYGKGQAALAVEVMRVLEAEKPKDLVADTSTPETLLVLNDLCANAAEVIRGF